MQDIVNLSAFKDCPQAIRKLLTSGSSSNAVFEIAAAACPIAAGPSALFQSVTDCSQRYASPKNSARQPGAHQQQLWRPLRLMPKPSLRRSAGVTAVCGGVVRIVRLELRSGRGGSHESFMTKL